MPLRALRGAITCDSNTKAEITDKTHQLVREVLERNGLAHDDLVSMFFTATEDLNAEFPATAARQLGLGDVPLLCAREIAVPGALPQVIRVMVHCDTDRPRSELHHVYHGAPRSLRDDLPQ